MSDPQPLSLASIIARLQQLCQEKLSGNMTIVAQNRQMARIGLKDGNIVALSCANKRGAEALSLLRQFEPNWFQFIKGTNIISDPDLPPTPDILNALSGASSIPANLGSAGGNTAIEVIAPQALTVLKVVLTEFMGPVAPMICNKVLRQARSLESAIDLLANEIPNQKQAIEFKARARQKLF